MKPKEKARQLFEFYLNIGMGDGWAKECALVVVEEVMSLDALSNLPLTLEYWKEVKREVEKL